MNYNPNQWVDFAVLFRCKGVPFQLSLETVPSEYLFVQLQGFIANGNLLPAIPLPHIPVHTHEAYMFFISFCFVNVPLQKINCPINDWRVFNEGIKNSNSNHGCFPDYEYWI